MIEGCALKSKLSSVLTTGKRAAFTRRWAARCSRSINSRAASCSQERTDYPTYLLRLAERELIEREQRAAQRRVKAARFPVVKTLDNFDFSAQPSINQPLMRELMSGEYIDRCENVLLVGNSGTGKT